MVTLSNSIWLKNETESPYGCFLKWWYPQIIHFNRVFHYKPSILGYPYFWNHPYIAGDLQNICPITAVIQLEIGPIKYIAGWIRWSLIMASPKWCPMFVDFCLFIRFTFSQVSKKKRICWESTGGFYSYIVFPIFNPGACWEYRCSSNCISIVHGRSRCRPLQARGETTPGHLSLW